MLSHQFTSSNNDFDSFSSVFSCVPAYIRDCRSAAVLSVWKPTAHCRCCSACDSTPVVIDDRAKQQRRKQRKETWDRKFSEMEPAIGADEHQQRSTLECNGTGGPRRGGSGAEVSAVFSIQRNESDSEQASET